MSQLAVDPGDDRQRGRQTVPSHSYATQRLERALFVCEHLDVAIVLPLAKKEGRFDGSTVPLKEMLRSKIPPSKAEPKARALA